MVPDLVWRVTTVPTGGRVGLSGHSQGSVITAAVLLQLDPGTARSVGLVTYGCPLRRLYGRIFPDLVGPRTLERVGERMSDGPDRMARESWRWRNCQRRTDPIGGFLYADVPPGDLPGCVDRQLLDPVFAPPPGSAGYPPVHGHSDYPSDPTYQQTLEEVVARITPRAEDGQAP